MRPVRPNPAHILTGDPPCMLPSAQNFFRRRRLALVLLLHTSPTFAASVQDAIAADAKCAPATSAVPLYGAYNPTAVDYILGTDESEITGTASAGYTLHGTQGFLFNASAPSSAHETVQLFRLWSKRFTDHLYTTDPKEVNSTIANVGYKLEEASMYVYPTQVCGSVPFYRMWSVTASSHFYTVSETERAAAKSAKEAWKDESVLGYVFSPDAFADTQSSSTAAPSLSSTPTDSGGDAGPSVVTMAGIAAGVGALIVLLALGGVYIGIRRRRRKLSTEAYRRFPTSPVNPPKSPPPPSTIEPFLLTPTTPSPRPVPSPRPTWLKDKGGGIARTDAEADSPTPTRLRAASATTRSHIAPGTSIRMQEQNAELQARVRVLEQQLVRTHSPPAPPSYVE
ncbi:hypothetical protein MKEN_00398600 [Mycena kentingensis (nom. inval.)]|nr:hypothetical protein MKEN_00398600 [Mycena kentingensis (nom. inval.)]